MRSDRYINRTKDMKKNSFIINMLLALGVLSSCTQVEDDEIALETTPEICIDQMYIDSNKDEIDIDDARKVATMFNSSMKDENASTRSFDVHDVIVNTISDPQSGQPLLSIGIKYIQQSQVMTTNTIKNLLVMLEIKCM